MATGTEIQVVMPQMGVSVSEGTITKWLKQVGEPIARDEPLLEISTDKVDTEVPSPGEGVVSQILVGEGQTVDVGTVLATIAPAGSAPAEPASESPPRAPRLHRPPSPRHRRRPSPSRPPSPRPPSRHRLRPLRRRAHRPRAPPGTGRASSRRSSRESRPSTASIRRPSRAPGRAAV